MSNSSLVQMLSDKVKILSQNQLVLDIFLTSVNGKDEQQNVAILLSFNQYDSLSRILYKSEILL